MPDPYASNKSTTVYYEIDGEVSKEGMRNKPRRIRSVLK
jgi:hypothetical protein